MTAPLVNAPVTSLRSRMCRGGSAASMVCATAGCRSRFVFLPMKKAAVSLERRGSLRACRASSYPVTR